MSNTPQVFEEKKGGFQKCLDVIEQIGNKFPSPFILFTCLAILVLLLSAVFDGTSASFIGKDGKPTVVKVLNLMNADGFRYILTSMVDNFIKFPPLGLVVVMMLAMGVAETTGLVGAFVRNIMTGVPEWAVTATIMFLGINGNLASDAAMVFMPAAAAAVFAGLGRNPILGMVVAFVATSAGFSANLLPAGTDALIAGITKSSIGIIPQTANSPAHPLINYYLMSSSVIILTIVGTLVAEKIVAPRLNRLMPFMTMEQEAVSSGVTPAEKKGLRWAGIAAIVYLVLLAVLIVPDWGILRDPKTHTIIPKSPLLDGVIPILFFFFMSVGVAFGVGKGEIKSESDVTRFMTKGLAGVLGFMVTAFSAAQFIAWFTKCNLATVLAVKGAEVLKDIGFTGIPLIVAFVLLSGFVDMFIMSGSAKWLIFAPVFVPMFGLLGYEPALTQAAYRIGESSINPISPLNYYVPVMLGIMAKYIDSKQVNVGLGTLMSAALPFAMWFVITWTLWLLVFVVFNLPLGPGAKIFV